MLNPLPTPTLLDALTAIVGPAGLLTDPADTAPYCRDWRGLYTGRTPAVVRPGGTAEVAFGRLSTPSAPPFRTLETLPVMPCPNCKFRTPIFVLHYLTRC